MIYFVTIIFNKKVHGGALGFTDRVYRSVKAKNALLAMDKARTHYNKKLENDEFGTKVKDVTVNLASSQTVSKYVDLIK